MVSHVLQVPVLFSGPLRANLDPFARHTDAQVWLALELCHMKERVRQLPAQLLHPVQRTSLAFRCVGIMAILWMPPANLTYLRNIQSITTYQNVAYLNVAILMVDVGIIVAYCNCSYLIQVPN